jgi:hypothetical protein
MRVNKGEYMNQGTDNSAACFGYFDIHRIER